MFWSYWKLALAVQETAIASSITIQQRLWRFALGDASAGREALSMVAEKQAAFAEALWALQKEAMRGPLVSPKTLTKASHAMLRPYRSKSRANARRLTRRR